LYFRAGVIGYRTKFQKKIKIKKINVSDLWAWMLPQKLVTTGHFETTFKKEK
jgi:hypothetical protein